MLLPTVNAPRVVLHAMPDVDSVPVVPKVAPGIDEPFTGMYFTWSGRRPWRVEVHVGRQRADRLGGRRSSTGEREHGHLAGVVLAVSDVGLVTADVEAVGPGEQGVRAGAARVAAGVPVERDAAGRVQGGDRRTGDRALLGVVGAVVVVQPSIVAADVDRCIGHVDRPQRVASGEVGPGRLHVCAGRARLEPGHAVAQGARAVGVEFARACRRRSRSPRSTNRRPSTARR